MRKVLIIGSILSLLFLKIASAESVPLTQDNMVRAVLGESEGEGFQGMLAVAYAINNRGYMKGVYGLKAISVRSGAFWRGSRQIASPTVSEAQKAVRWAYWHPEKDLTHGATHWEGTVFKKPYWAKHMTKTLTVGHQAFYKE